MRNRKFEEWFAARCDIPCSYVADMWKPEYNEYRSINYHVELAWAAWCAALGFTKE